MLEGGARLLDIATTFVLMTATTVPITFYTDLPVHYAGLIGGRDVGG